MPTTHLLFLLLLLSFIPPSKTQENSTNTDPSYYYNLCSSSKCDNISLPYPFGLPSFCHHPSMTPFCTGDGFLHLRSEHQTGSLRAIGNLTGYPTGASFRVAQDSLFGCGEVSSPNYTVGPSLFSLPNNYTYGTHLNCTRPPTSLAGLQPASCLGCKNGPDRANVCYYSPGFVSFPECENFFVFLPLGFNVSAENDLRGYLQLGFPIQYSKSVECQSCEGTGGLCGTSPKGDFVCFCKQSVHQTNCSDGVFEDLKAWFPSQGGSGSSSKTLVIALSTSASILVLFVLTTLVFIIALRRKSPGDTENSADNEKGLKDLVDGISPTRYSYSQIKKFTNNFLSKLGEGGFGNIYGGAIQKGKHETLVAVKILKVSKQSEKQFMNEVATIGRIHHNNLVRMLGYCVQGKKRALVYEYMENGSLDKYIDTIRKRDLEGLEDGSDLKHHLSTKQMYSIALETARGILYLHEGCRSRIIHCDIKPHNVLLDSNLSAKVSDFGLARMIDKDRSHISLTVARGTPGYAAPEIWSKSYGPVTDKSDVYSYGMLILEMAGGRIKYEPDIAAPPRQVDLPEWAFKLVKKKKLGASKDLANSNESIDDENNGENDEEVVERMCLVGLWCIQHIPSDRPSMSRVIQMLEGNVDIEIPPDPFPHDGGNEQPNYLTASTVYLNTKEETA